MSTHTIANARWATASHADATDTQPIEIDALGAHYGHCQGSRGRWFGLECVGEAAHGFFAPRLVTTLSLAVVVLAASALLS